MSSMTLSADEQADFNAAHKALVFLHDIYDQVSESLTALAAFPDGLLAARAQALTQLNEQLLATDALPAAANVDQEALDYLWLQIKRLFTQDMAVYQQYFIEHEQTVLSLIQTLNQHSLDGNWMQLSERLAEHTQALLNYWQSRS